jgi:hypothetical protein
MDESSNTQNRRSRRSNVLLAASVEISGAVIPVKLRNLSASGALIEGDNLPLEGSEVVFRRNDLIVKSRIAWVGRKHAGLAFYSPLQQEEVLRNIPKPKPRVATDFRRPGLYCRELSKEERRMGELWAVTAPLGSLGE